MQWADQKLKCPPAPYQNEETEDLEPHQWITLYDNVDKTALTMQLHPQEHTHWHTHTCTERTHRPPKDFNSCRDEGRAGSIPLQATLIGLGAASGGHGSPSPTLRLTPFVHKPRDAARSNGIRDKGFWTLCCNYKYIPMGERETPSSTVDKTNRDFDNSIRLF